MSQLASKHLSQVIELLGNMDQLIYFCIHSTAYTNFIKKIKLRDLCQKLFKGTVSGNVKQVYTSVFLHVGSNEVVIVRPSLCTLL